MYKETACTYVPMCVVWLIEREKEEERREEKGEKERESERKERDMTAMPSINNFKKLLANKDSK